MGYHVERNQGRRLRGKVTANPRDYKYKVRSEEGKVTAKGTSLKSALYQRVMLNTIEELRHILKHHDITEVYKKIRNPKLDKIRTGVMETSKVTMKPYEVSESEGEEEKEKPKDKTREEKRNDATQKAVREEAERQKKMDKMMEHSDRITQQGGSSGSGIDRRPLNADEKKRLKGLALRSNFGRGLKDSELKEYQALMERDKANKKSTPTLAPPKPSEPPPKPSEPPAPAQRKETEKEKELKKLVADEPKAITFKELGHMYALRRQGGRLSPQQKTELEELEKRHQAREDWEKELQKYPLSKEERDRLRELERNRDNLSDAESKERLILFIRNKEKVPPGTYTQKSKK